MTFPTRRTMSITLAANQEMRVNISGSFIAIVSATDDFQIQFDGQGWLDTGRGFGYPGGIDPATGEPSKFEYIGLKETKGAPNVIQIVYGEGVVIDNRAVFGGENVPVDIKTSITVPVENQAPVEVKPLAPPILGTLGDATIGAGASVLIASGYVARAEMFILNDGVERVYLRGDNTLVASGLALEPGEKITLKTTADVYAYNPSGVGVKLRIDDTRWS